MENLTSHIIDLHVVDSQRRFLTDLRNTKYQKVLSLMSLSTESLKRQKISDRIIQFSIEVFKTTCLLINIRKCKKKKKKEKESGITA